MSRRILQQSRSDILWTLLSLVAFQAGLALAVACWLPELRDPAFAYKAEMLARRTTEASVRPFLVLMVGTSRTAYGLEGQRLEKRYGQHGRRPLVVFNFGIPAGGAVTGLLTVRRLLAEGIRPDHLLIEITPPFLAGQPKAPREVDFLSPTRLRRDELDLAGRFGIPEAQAREAWWHSCLAPAYAHRFNILSRLLPRWIPQCLRQNWARETDASGWRPFFANMPGSLDRARRVEFMRKEYASYLKGFRLGGYTCEALRELLTLCRSEGIPASLVVMPEGTAFRSWYRPGAWQEIEAFLTGLSEEFGVPLVNAHEWVDDEGFADSHHMIDSGVVQFTDRLGEEVLQPMLERAHNRP